jgi:hypothetical protein
MTANSPGFPTYPSFSQATAKGQHLPFRVSGFLTHRGIGSSMLMFASVPFCSGLNLESSVPQTIHTRETTCDWKFSGRLNKRRATLVEEAVTSTFGGIT